MATNYINHIALVLDASSSMTHLAQDTITVADQQITYLAQRSQELDQETRATIYTFNTNVKCVFYDKDVLRLPSLKNDYRPQGRTALVDATIQAIRDLQQTATLYGDHAFLIYVLTDGQENQSINGASELKKLIETLPDDNYTVAVLVPDQRGVFEAKRFGFPPNNIATWDVSAEGITEVGETIRRATDNYMLARTRGVRSSTNIFQLDVEKLSPSTLQSNLIELPRNKYQVYGVAKTDIIAPFVNRMTGQPYTVGQAFYELSKSETIQPQKQVLVFDRKTGSMYGGESARQLLGLPSHHVRVRPSDHPNYDIFVQSTSVNRKLMPNTKLVVVQ